MYISDYSTNVAQMHWSQIHRELVIVNVLWYFFSIPCLYLDFENSWNRFNSLKTRYNFSLKGSYLSWFEQKSDTQVSTKHTLDILRRPKNIEQSSQLFFDVTIKIKRFVFFKLFGISQNIWTLISKSCFKLNQSQFHDRTEHSEALVVKNKNQNRVHILFGLIVRRTSTELESKKKKEKRKKSRRRIFSAWCHL